MHFPLALMDSSGSALPTETRTLFCFQCATTGSDFPASSTPAKARAWECDLSWRSQRNWMGVSLSTRMATEPSLRSWFRYRSPQRKLGPRLGAAVLVTEPFWTLEAGAGESGLPRLWTYCGIAANGQKVP